MKVIELLTEERKTTPDEFMRLMHDFLPLAMKHLKIDRLPDFKLVTRVPDTEQPTFGKFVPHENRIYLAIEQRHPLDVLRTLAHELTHFRQGTEHELGPDSGRTGSPTENEAHEVAGIIMRHFNKAHPEYFQDCAINILESAAWQKSSGKNKNGGLNKKGVNSYRREHPGSKLQTAVTTKPSKLKKGSKASKRRKSFCARMKGMKKHRTGAKTKHDPNSRINKSLRKWNCESVEEMRELIMLGENYISNLKEAGNPAQQAAIAISMKKHHQKPKHTDENFADGRHPEDKGDSKRHGINTKASVSSLRNTAKHSSGRKQELAHWLANMKSGRAKHSK
jgi:hypothetical protein